VSLGLFLISIEHIETFLRALWHSLCLSFELSTSRTSYLYLSCTGFQYRFFVFLIASSLNLKLEFRGVSPSSLECFWPVNSSLGGVYHHISQEEHDGTDRKFSLLRLWIIELKTPFSSPYLSLSIGEEIQLCRGIIPSISPSSLSSARSRGRRRSWHLGPAVSDLISRPMELKGLVLV